MLFVVQLRDEGTSSQQIKQLLKLVSTQKTSNMHAFDADGNIRLYSDAAEIEAAHFACRFAAYGEGRKHLIEVLEGEAKLLSEKVRFMLLKAEGAIRVDNVGFDEIMRSIESHGFEPLGSPVSFDYMLSVRLFDFTSQNVERLRKMCEGKGEELRRMQSISVEEM